MGSIKKHTKQERRDWIMDYMTKNPEIAYEDVRKKITKNFLGFSRTTLYKDFAHVRDIVEERRRKRMEAREKLHDELDLIETKNVIKTKTERLIEYQKLVSECFTDLASGTTRDTYFDKNTGKPKRYRRPMTIQEYNQTRRTLKEIQVEISKIEGDYAPEIVKTDHTTKGEKMESQVVWKFVNAKK